MFQLLTFNVNAAKVRRETLEGRDHLVVPATMLAEGAWKGEYGTFYYPADELKKSVPRWDHKPVVVYHPMKDGEAVTACSPGVLNTQKVGVILNTRFDEKTKKLKAEVWIDEARCKEVDPRVVNAINKKQLTETSTGLAMMSDEAEGEWVHNSSGDKRKYQGTTSDYDPDHLAILPDQVGAYSVKDGGGLLQVNAKGEVTADDKATREGKKAAAKGPRAAKKYLRRVFAANALSFSTVRQQLYELLAAKYGEKGKSWYGDIIDIFPDYCVFCTYGDRSGEMWKQDYTTTGDVVALSGEAVKVVRATEYVAVQNKAAVESVNHQEPSVTKKQKIDALIANSDGAFTEEERTDYEGWTEARIDRHLKSFEKKVEQQNKDKKDPPKKEEPKTEPEVITMTKAEYDALQTKAKKVDQQNAEPTLEESLKTLHPSIQRVVQKSLAREDAEKKFLINKIKEKSPNFNPAYLEKAEIEELEQLADLAGVKRVEQHNGRVPMFIGNAGGSDTDTDPDPETGFDDEPVDWKKVSQRNNAGGRRLGRSYDDFGDEE